MPKHNYPYTLPFQGVQHAPLSPPKTSSKHLQVSSTSSFVSPTTVVPSTSNHSGSTKTAPLVSQTSLTSTSTSPISSPFVGSSVLTTNDDTEFSVQEIINASALQASFTPYKPWHNPTEPFVTKKRNGHIKKCQGCHVSIKDEKNSTPHDYVIAHRENNPYPMKIGKNECEFKDSFGPGHYHVNLTCIKHRHPYFHPVFLVIPPTVKLTTMHYNFYRSRSIPIASRNIST